MYGYIYITTNLVNGRKYIGQKKWYKYPNKHPTYLGSGKILKQAILKYGPENFSCRILQWCYSKWELDAREKAWILMYDAVNSNEFYNISKGGFDGVFKTINSLKPWKPRFGKNNSFYGKKHTQKTKNLISNKGKGKPAWNKGIPCRPETKEKLRMNHLGVSNWTDEMKIKHSIRVGGENNPSAKLTNNDVLEIVKCLRSGKSTRKELSKKYNVSLSCIDKIITGRTFSKLTGIRRENNV